MSWLPLLSKPRLLLGLASHCMQRASRHAAMHIDMSRSEGPRPDAEVNALHEAEPTLVSYHSLVSSRGRWELALPLALLETNCVRAFSILVPNASVELCTQH